MTDDPLYLAYHDHEWGAPIREDRALFELLTLETFQAGLSWLVVLRKRAAFRAAFADFEIEAVAGYGERELSALLQNPGIIRNRAKLEAAIHNAQAVLAVQEQSGSFSAYAWSFVGGEPLVNHWRDASEVPARTPLAEAFSKDLKRRGFRFVGPTVVYAYLQACGMVMDHTTGCFRYPELASGR